MPQVKTYICGKMLIILMKQCLLQEQVSFIMQQVIIVAIKTGLFEELDILGQIDKQEQEEVVVHILVLLKVVLLYLMQVKDEQELLTLDEVDEEVIMTKIIVLLRHLGDEIIVLVQMAVLEDLL
ncbi:MAG: hypothetical protein LBU14_02285 [Candidatus Peribacteria bacterium]|nr:hypothetical protein [Candidatus Peribacteria bacterium]